MEDNQSISGKLSHESLLWLLWDARRARKQGPVSIVERQRARLAEAVTFARTNSPYFRELYQGLPERVEDPALLPVTRKKELMARFDDWVTDREVTIEKTRAFIANLDLIGEKFLGEYFALATSGTTGTPGLFLKDQRELAVTNTLALRMLSAWLNLGDILKILIRGGRTAMVCAMGGHYAEPVAAARLRRRLGKRIQAFPADMPLSEMVDQLNRFRPTILAPYASIGALLAGEQEAGRLHINPVLVVLSAEGLPAGGYDRITRAFGVKAHHSCVATECMFISYNCDQGWLHVDADWAVLEPVDADYRPVPPGTQSHTVLISNLANRVQPILRYDLGDRILERPDPCPCGNPLPAIRVQGRTADMLTFSTERGEQVSIPALMFEIVDAPGIELFQIVQTTPTSLRVRLRMATGADPDRVWQAVLAEITRVLTERKLDHVIVERGEEPPEQTPGGKFRAVIPLNRDRVENEHETN